MSFLKISDPNKREFIVNEHLKTKKNIQQSFLNERIGDFNQKFDLTKLYKPITDAQQAVAANTNLELAKIKEATQQAAATTTNALQALPAQLKALTFPQYPSILATPAGVQAAEEDPVESVRTLELGEIATQYLQKYASSKRDVDTTFGLYSKDGIFYIGKSPVTIHNDDITIGDTTYSGSPGLWELLTLKNPDDTIYTHEDLINYQEIILNSNAKRRDDNPNKPKASRSEKYKEIIKPLWDATSKKGQKQTKQKITKVSTVPTAPTGSSLSTIVLPSDPNELIDMLGLRMASFKAGNNGVRNEIISISDTLKSMGVLDSSSYKSLMIQISK